MKLKDKVAIVTGGGTGIGRATALLSAAERADVAVVGRREGRLLETVNDIRELGGSSHLRLSATLLLDCLIMLFDFM
jgi:NAD(P)-dependent dehydrogenase (short-subunit alcohol dehydrogenase family)